MAANSLKLAALVERKKEFNVAYLEESLSHMSECLISIGYRYNVACI